MTRREQIVYKTMSENIARAVLRVEWGEDGGVEYNEVYDDYGWWCMGDMLEAVDAES